MYMYNIYSYDSLYRKQYMHIYIYNIYKIKNHLSLVQMNNAWCMWPSYRDWASQINTLLQMLITYLLIRRLSFWPRIFWILGRDIFPPQWVDLHHRHCLGLRPPPHWPPHHHHPGLAPPGEWKVEGVLWRNTKVCRHRRPLYPRRSFCLLQNTDETNVVSVYLTSTTI